jgi:hypothetical protein
MGYENHDVKNVNADLLLKGAHGVLVGVKIMKIGSAGSKVVFRNGVDASAPEEFYVNGEGVLDIGHLNRRFENGIFADVTGTAEYLVIFK